VKDLGRTLGIFVVVTNCSDEHKFRDMAKIFKGVCQSGLWGCFDEFNRISLATLSVVAAQVESITSAKKLKLKNFMFPNEERPIRLVSSCAYFITMNPGYAGRQELPENLKVLFRGVTMMLPNRQVIMMVKLASVGYSSYQPLSKKFNVLYKLCEEQLSKQRHYDFGLRNILSVLRTAGNSKRAEAVGCNEEMIMARTLRDMNLSKFVAQDQPLFASLIKDIFPQQDGKIPNKTYPDVQSKIKDLVKGPAPHGLDLQEVAAWNVKIIQLYETSLVRHGFMLVGAAGCGKTTIMNVLTEALGNIPGHDKIEIKKMNPKAITGQQMYGVMNNLTGEWVPGVYSQIWKLCNNKANKKIFWINCDGPVDPIWIENLNTVLDDNKILTLANAERIPMSDKCKMTFEVENLDNASPATVSRCGIIYVSPTDLGWEPLFTTWCLDRIKEKTNIAPEEKDWIELFVKKYLTGNDLINTLGKSFTYVMPVPAVIRVTQMLSLLDAVLSQFLNVEVLSKKDFEHFFVYAFTWAFGGLFETEDRQRFQREILEKAQNAPLPQISQHKANFDKETIFDYFVDPETKTWKLWQAASWTAPRRILFSQLLIPTTDSTRAEYIVKKIASLPYEKNLLRGEKGLRHTLLVGGPGTAKTSVIIMYSGSFDQAETLFKRINFSSATTPLNFQEAIESEVERKQARIYVPLGGKNMAVFLDDVSMPFVNNWGDQITLEITRQLIDQKGFYFLSKDDRGSFKNINQLQFLAAMNHPGGGRNDIPNRLKRLFFSLNMTPPSTRSIENIYGRIMETIFKPKYYQKDIIDMRELIITATIMVWETVSKKLLPTPAKFHYVFNIRELARVFGGVCKVAQQYEHKVIEKTSKLKEKIQPQLFYIALWRHECERTFVDKLINNNDKKSFMEILNRVTKEKFRES
jgi:dynein heavy chain